MIHQGTDRTPVSWPHVNQTPLNEFRTEGYMSMAFPSLCPTGWLYLLQAPTCMIKLSASLVYYHMYIYACTCTFNIHIIVINTGAADFTAPWRLRPVTIGYYFRHLMLDADGRFTKHPRFHFFCAQYRDEMAGSASWQDICETAPTGCTTVS